MEMDNSTDVYDVNSSALCFIPATPADAFPEDTEEFMWGPMDMEPVKDPFKDQGNKYSYNSKSRRIAIRREPLLNAKLHN